jgi:small subunit ribosomal protein S2
VAQEVGIRELLEAGVHFGHQTRRWNPKMRRFIYGERGGIYIIDLLRTEQLLAQAQRFADGLARRGGTVLFVGTKKQARDGVKEIAEASGQPYVNHRWLGGLLTNFQTISLRIKRLHDLERYETEGQLGLLPTRERMAAQADLEKLRANLGGVKNMQRVPDALFVIDLKTEAIAVREAQRLRIPIIGLVDTNCDPDGIDYVIPGNDDGIRACNIIARAIGDVIQAGNRSFREAEERARQEAAEQARREAEEKARREAEEQARREAEEAAIATLSQGGEGEPRDVAEATVAEAVQELGRPQAEGRRQAEAAAAAQAADEPAMPAGGAGGGTTARRANPNVGERLPQGAGASQGAGAPASDTAAGAPGAESAPSGEAPPARRSRARARKAKAEPAQTAAPEPGPSPIAEAAAAEAPPEPDPAAATGPAEPAPAAEPAPPKAAPAEPAPTETPAVEAVAAESAPPEATEAPPAKAAPAKAEPAQSAPTEPAPAAPAPAEAAPAESAPTDAPSAGGSEDEDDGKGIVDRAQDAANTAVDTAQDVAAGAVGAAESVADVVADRAPGPLGSIAGVAAGAAGAVKNAVADSDSDEKKTENQEKDSQ